MSHIEDLEDQSFEAIQAGVRRAANLNQPVLFNFGKRARAHVRVIGLNPVTFEPYGKYLNRGPRLEGWHPLTSIEEYAPDNANDPLYLGLVKIGGLMLGGLIEGSRDGDRYLQVMDIAKQVGQLGLESAA